MPDDRYHNLNCLSPEEYCQLIYEAIVYIRDKYGIFMTTEDLTYKDIEINKTIVLSEPYKCYQRPLDLITYLLPRTMGDDTCCHNKDGKKKKTSDYKRVTTNYDKESSKKRITLKFYNKTEHLKVFKIDVLKDYLRLEVTLKCPSKIKDALGTNKVNAITTEIINRYFNKFVKYYLAKPYSAHCKRRDPDLRQILKERYKPSSRTWVRETLMSIASTEIDAKVTLMLDVQELIDQLKCLPITSKHTRHNIKRAFLKCFPDDEDIGEIIFQKIKCCMVKIKRVCSNIKGFLHDI